MEVKKDSLKAWLLAARPKTLTGAAVPVMIGLALAWTDAKAMMATCLAGWQPCSACSLPSSCRLMPTSSTTSLTMQKVPMTVRRAWDQNVLVHRDG